MTDVVGRIVSLDQSRERFSRDLEREFPGIRTLTHKEYAAKVAHRRSGDDRRKSVQRLVLAARLSAQRLRDLGDVEQAEALESAVEGMRE